MYRFNTLFSFQIATAVIVMCSDGIELNGKEIVNTCHLYRNHKRISREKEMTALVIYLTELTPQLSAAGFFRINQKMLSTIFSAVITYLIVIIQFNKAI